MKTALHIAATALAAGIFTGTTGMTEAADIKVMASAAFKEAYLELVPQFERSSGHKVVTLFVPSVDMMVRLKGGEQTDLVIMSRQSIDQLTDAGRIVPGGRTDLAKSGIGIGIRKNAPKPDISSSDAFKRALLAAKSIAYSTGPSGVYLAGLFQRMGIADELKSRIKVVKGEPVGAVVARGEAEIGFQQVSELLPVAGIDFLGPLPADIQQITTFSAGLSVNAKEAEAAKTLVKFLTAPAAAPVIRSKGMEPG